MVAGQGVGVAVVIAAGSQDGIAMPAVLLTTAWKQRSPPRNTGI